MRKISKKLFIVVCMLACIGGTCTGCANKDTQKNQKVEEPTSSEAPKEEEILEKEVVIEGDPNETMEFSLEGAANDSTTTTPSDAEKQQD